MSRQEELEAFLKAVLRMREHQKGYFRTRSGELLRQAKKWEQAVDKKITELTCDGPEPRKCPCE